jgi:uncharacterized protein (TIGR03437 family)
LFIAQFTYVIYKEEVLQLPVTELAPRKFSPKIVFLFIPTLLLLLALTLIRPPAATTAAKTYSPDITTYDWLQFNGNAQHSGNNTQERLISPGSVSALRLAFRVTLPSASDGSPVYLSGVTVAGGKRDLIFITTKAGHIVALDARTGATIWSNQSNSGNCVINHGATPCYTTSSPAIDPNRQYVYSYGLDGYAHKYRVGDGMEVIGGGWPQLVSLKPNVEKVSSALTIATAKNGTSYLYVAHGGYPGDAGDYQGHLTAINLATGAQRVFNAACSDKADTHFAEAPGTPTCSRVQTAIWARAGVVYSPETDRIYMATGNGEFDPAQRHWGDTVFALRPEGSGINGAPVDSYTPTNYAQLNEWDADLGSTAPAIMQAPAGSRVKNLALQGGKDQQLRLLNLDNLSGKGGPGNAGGEVSEAITVPQEGAMLTAPAVWTNPADGSAWAFVTTYNGISALRLFLDDAGNPSLRPMWINYTSGSSPLVANNVLFFARGNLILAFDPMTGRELWRDTTIGGIHWQTPVVANGMLYIADQGGNLSAYAIDEKAVVSVSAADYRTTLAPDQIAAGFGISLAEQSLTAGAAPLPIALDGVTVKVRDSANVERSAPIFFVSPTQVNYQVPAGVALGPATITIADRNGVATGQTQIVMVSPGIFTFNANGQGVAAAIAARASANGAQTIEPVAQLDPTQKRYVPVPINLGPETDQVYLILYGTGLRHRSALDAVSVKIGGLEAKTIFAGAQGDYIGLDQINVLLPRGLVGSGETDVSVTVDGLTANPVTINIQ